MPSEMLSEMLCKTSQWQKNTNITLLSMIANLTTNYLQGHFFTVLFCSLVPTYTSLSQVQQEITLKNYLQNPVPLRRTRTYEKYNMCNRIFRS